MYCAKRNVDNIYACVKYYVIKYVCQQKNAIYTFDRLLIKRNFASCLHKKFRLLKITAVSGTVGLHVKLI